MASIWRAFHYVSAFARKVWLFGMCFGKVVKSRSVSQDDLAFMVESCTEPGTTMKRFVFCTHSVSFGV